MAKTINQELVDEQLAEVSGGMTWDNVLEGNDQAGGIMRAAGHTPGTKYEAMRTVEGQRIMVRYECVEHQGRLVWQCTYTTPHNFDNRQAAVVVLGDLPSFTKLRGELLRQP